MGGKKLRVLLAKPGLCVHDVGIKIVATTLKNAGMEVIYSGLFQTPEGIANSAIQEDADIIGINVVMDPAVPTMKEIMKVLEEKEIDIPVVCGGRINKKDIPVLREMGVKGIFRSGAPLGKIVEGIRGIARQ